MKNILLIIITLFLTNKGYSQCACCAGAGIGSSNGDYNNGILTLARKKWVVEGYADYRTIKVGEDHHENIDTTAEEETPLRSILINSLGLRYGINDKITVSVLLPYAFLFTKYGNDKGLGDLILLGTFNIYSKRNFNFALQGGVELPTGIQKGANFDNTTVVVGSGSVDPMAGLAFSKRWNKLILQGNGLFKYTTQGFDKTSFGNLSVQNVSLAYQFKGKNKYSYPDSTYQSKNPNFGWMISGGYYGEWLDQIKSEEERIDENSGYYLGFATLGSNISFKSWNFPLTLSYPLIQKMNGTQNDAGLRVRVGLIKSF